MDSDRMKERICENAAEIVRLHSRIHETLAQRSKSSERKREWEQACAELHARYEGLAFPGGYRGALDRISSGDTEAMEAAICFLESRPYFFRSGYMFKDILRRCRRAPLFPEQAARLKVIEQKLLEWRERKLAKKRK
jgi:DNA repair exonuclease SbcCD ATPase subunit